MGDKTERTTLVVRVNVETPYLLSKEAKKGDLTTAQLLDLIALKIKKGKLELTAPINKDSD